MKFGFEGPRRASSTKSEEKTTERGTVGNLARAAALGALVSMSPQKSTHEEHATNRYEDRVHAEEQLKEFGITDEQKEAYGPASKALEQGLSPFGYTSPESDGTSWNLGEDMARVMKGLAIGSIRDENERTRTDMVEKIRTRFNISEDAANNAFNSRMDAFRLYLGLPQEHDTFGISEYKPTKSTEDKFYYKINRFVEDFEEVTPGVKEQEGVEGLSPQRKKEVLRWMWLSAKNSYDPEFITEDMSSGIMGRYTLTRGEDEAGAYVSYYDKWDLGASVEGVADGGVMGKPFEIYDRIYINDTSTLPEKNPLDVRNSPPPQ